MRKLLGNESLRACLLLGIDAREIEAEQKFDAFVMEAKLDMNTSKMQGHELLSVVRHRKIETRLPQPAIMQGMPEISIIEIAIHNPGSNIRSYWPWTIISHKFLSTEIFTIY